MALKLVGKREVNVYACTCERCGHKWESVGDDPPRTCAGCKQRNWNKPAGVLPLGRPSLDQVLRRKRLDAPAGVRRIKR